MADQLECDIGSGGHVAPSQHGLKTHERIAHKKKWVGLTSSFNSKRRKVILSFPRSLGGIGERLPIDRVAQALVEHH